MVQRFRYSSAIRFASRVLGREVRHEMKFPVAVAGRRIQDHRNAAHEEDFAGVGIGQPHRLLEDLAGVDPATRAAFCR